MKNSKEQIEEYRHRRNAVILVHNYALGEVQDIGDFVGDSLGLSREAAETDADVIVFCGVHFMAETAAILCPGKTVLVPDEHAGCPMADMITPRQLREFKKEHPGAVVVTYVNSSAAIKAESDICVTSANAVDIVASFPEDQEILFVPDQNLGSYVATQLQRPITVWPGFCPTHHRLLPEFLHTEMERHPTARVVVHPECRPAVVKMADKVASTTGILRYCHESEHTEFIIGTEIGILHRLQKENPDKTFYPAMAIMDCPNMKLNNLQKVLWCLQDMAPQVTVPDDIAEQARRPIERMLKVSRSR